MDTCAFRKKLKRNFVIICFATLTLSAMTSCASKRITAEMPREIDCGKCGSYAMLDGVLYYTNERFYDRCLSPIDKDGEKKICDKSDINCRLEDKVQSYNGSLIFSGRNSGNTLFFTYDPKSEMIEKLAVVKGLTYYWCRRDNRIYYLTYGENDFVYTLNCCDIETGTCTAVGGSVIDFIISNNSLVYVSKNESKYSVLKETRGDKFELYSFSCDSEHVPSFALSTEACVAYYYGEFAKLITFENGATLDLDKDIDGAILSGDTVYYICYCRKDEYKNPDPTGLYVQKAENREATLLTNILDTPRLICAYSNGTVLLEQKAGRIRTHIELSLIDDQEEMLVARC